MATTGGGSGAAKADGVRPPADNLRPIPSRSRPMYDAERSSLVAPPRNLWSTNQKSARAHHQRPQKPPASLHFVPEKTLFSIDEQELGHVQPGAVHVMGANRPSSRSMDTRDDSQSARIQQEMVPYEPANIDNPMLSAIAVEDSSVVHEAKIIHTKRQRIFRILFVAAIVIIVIGVVVPVVLTISKDNNSAPFEIRFETMIENLCSPRHLTVHNGKIYVPEAGVGPLIISGDRETPPALCLPSSLRAISGDICFGNTGQVNMFHLDGSADKPPLTGLFSARPTEGGFTNQVYGASGVDFDDDGNMFTILGLGYVNATDLGIQGPELVFASVLRGNEAVASPWINVFEENYGGAPVPESNPFDICIHDGTTYVVDAGADLLYTYLNIETAGTTREPDSVVVLPKIRNIPAVKPNPRGGPCNDVDPPNGPSFCGQYKDEQGNWLYTGNAVPTAVKINPKEPSQLFIAYLGGAIWNEPVSGIFVMDLVNGVPQNETIYSIQGDFWGVIDFDFYENDMFVLETNPGGFVPFDGRLSRIRVDTNGSISDFQVITEDLYQPVSMTIREDTIYLSNNTFNLGIDGCNGQILRAQLR